MEEPSSICNLHTSIDALQYFLQCKVTDDTCYLLSDHRFMILMTNSFFSQSQVSASTPSFLKMMQIHSCQWSCPLTGMCFCYCYMLHHENELFKIFLLVFLVVHKQKQNLSVAWYIEQTKTLCCLIYLTNKRTFYCLIYWTNKNKFAWKCECTGLSSKVAKLNKTFQTMILQF